MYKYQVGDKVVLNKKIYKITQRWYSDVSGKLTHSYTIGKDGLEYDTIIDEEDIVTLAIIISMDGEII